MKRETTQQKKHSKLRSIFFPGIMTNATTLFAPIKGYKNINGEHKIPKLVFLKATSEEKAKIDPTEWKDYGTCKNL